MDKRKHLSVYSLILEQRPLTIQAMYYSYSVVESRVWVNGVVGLLIEVE